ncbi:APC family permease [Mycoplasmopsis sturni]|uniref:APC family permease n=1 Tax=Mycoplasmopsis sturni TaxID=39047 RepID=UPI00068D616A|nr:APC family permease [Mycoplasmopsis sturni]
MSKLLTSRQFRYFSINMIVGFGLISTVLSVSNLGGWGFLIILITGFMTMSTGFVFSRLAQKYSETYGGSYAYAREIAYKTKRGKRFKRNFQFFVGWNQFIQGPILSATTPLFLTGAATVFTQDTTTINIVRIASFVFYIILVLISTFGLKVNKKVILASAIIKWSTLMLSVFLLLYLAISDNYFIQNIVYTKDITQGNAQYGHVAPYAIFSSIVSFMYAFGGYESLSAMTKDVKTNNFRSILMGAFWVILIFYMLFYLIVFNVNSNLFFSDSSKTKEFSNIFARVWGITGLIIFVIGLVFNNISSKLSTSYTGARQIVPLAEDGYLPKWVAKRSEKYGEYRNAMWFAVILTIVSLITFWILPTFIPSIHFLFNVINLGTISFFIQYILTFVTSLILEKQNRIEKIPLWEKILYYLGILSMFVVVMVYIFPFFVGQPWTDENTITLVSFVIFVGIGYVIYAWVHFGPNHRRHKDVRNWTI